jgi:hypothetical protein
MKHLHVILFIAILAAVGCNKTFEGFSTGDQEFAGNSDQPPTSSPTSTPTPTPGRVISPSEDENTPGTPNPLLVQQEDIEYLGAFLFPVAPAGPSRFGYGGKAPAYYKDSAGRETLFVEGHVWYPGYFAQVQIPALVKATSTTALKRATLLQSFSDITDGALGGRSGDRMGASLIYKGRIISQSYVYYDADVSQEKFIGASGFNLATPNDFTGFFAPSGINPGKLGTYSTVIPPEWRTSLGGPALSGACCLSIISRTNSGPGVSVFDPDHVGVENPVPFKEILGYPLEHPVKFGTQNGACTSQNGVFNCTTTITAAAFPENRSSVLFFGAHGEGPVCYKDDGPESCRGTGGYNAPPYRAKVWAYDANDLLKVKNGTKKPWEISPYAIWTQNFSFNKDGVSISGGTYDPETRRLFLVESNGEDPIVHVLKIK